MKAAIWTKYGGPEVLEIREIEKPIPKADELLIKVVAATVTAGDCELRRFEIAKWIWLPLRLYMGILKPRIPVIGQELSGIIEEVGEKVTGFKVGQEIFTIPGMTFGAYAQYKCLKANKVICEKPTNITLDEAATIPTGGINALHFIRKAKIRQDERLLINGAGGSIGTIALQLGKMEGAKVTCVDREDKLDMLKYLGADEVIDYKNEDFTLGKNRYDVIIDIVGKSDYSRSVKILREGGRYILGNPKFSDFFRSIWTNSTSNKKVIPALAGESIQDLRYLKGLIESDKLKIFIDRTFNLEEIVKAHEYVEAGNKKGHLLIKIPH